MKSILCCVVLLAWGSLTAPAADKEVKLSADEQKVVERINQVRKAAKLPPLKPNAILCDCARRHARVMAKKGQLKPAFDGKSVTDQAKAAGYNVDRITALVARGDTGQLAPVFKQLMADKICRGFILRREMTEVGVGLAPDGKGEVYYDIILAKPQ